MKKDLFEFFQFLIFTAIVIASFISFVDGAVEAGRTGCKIERLYDYYPARWVGCELFKKRWAAE